MIRRVARNRSGVSGARPRVTSLERATHPPPEPPAIERRTFVDVYNDRYRPMVEIARLTTGSNALAEELVQDAFADLYRRFDTLHTPDAYLHRAVVSRCTSWVRRRVTERRYHERHPLEPAAWTDPDTTTVIDAIGRLPARQRAAIVLRFLADWPEADIAHALDCRPGTVKSLLSRARTQLAKELTDEH
ncbi:MAG: sigma-70 family RNA polymerase sigma factor [Acidimicrobiales bacterium]